MRALVALPSFMEEPAWLAAPRSRMFATFITRARAHAAGPGDVCVPSRPCIPNNGLITPQGELPPRWLLQGHPAAQLFTRSLTHFLRSATISMSASFKHRNLPAVSQLKPLFNSFCNASNEIK